MYIHVTLVALAHIKSSSAMWYPATYSRCRPQQSPLPPQCRSIIHWGHHSTCTLLPTNRIAQMDGFRRAYRRLVDREHEHCPRRQHDPLPRERRAHQAHGARCLFFLLKLGLLLLKDNGLITFFLSAYLIPVPHHTYIYINIYICVFVRNGYRY